MIYLDYASTSPLKQKVLEGLHKCLNEEFANPSSAHKLGKGLAKKLEQLEKDFLKDFDPEAELIFTSGATESNNMIIKGLDFEDNEHILYNRADHPSIVNVVESQKTPRVAFDEKNLLEKINGKSRLLLLTHIHNLSGVITPYLDQVKEIKKKYPRLHVHIDGAQAFGKYSISDIGADSYCFSGHKFGGPKGIGGLFLNSDVDLKPLIEGGGQQKELRSGTINYPFIHALSLAYKQREDAQKVMGLKEMIKSELKEYFQFPFEHMNTSAFILLAQIEKVSSDILLRFLESKNIYISSSSACSSKIKGFNPTYNAMGIEEKYHKNILRISLSSQTNQEEIKQFCIEVKEVFKEIKHLLRK